MWLLSELLSGQSLLPAVQASIEQETFFVVRLACSFRPRNEKVSVRWARFPVHLLPDEGGAQPLAFDLYPSSVERERQVSKKVTLNPSLKFLEVGASVGEFGYAVEYLAVAKSGLCMGCKGPLVRIQSPRHFLLPLQLPGS